MVLLTFDDSVHANNMVYYDALFTRKRRNPNGCPISGTFFVSNEDTDYDKVRQLWKRGHEIADHTGPVGWAPTSLFMFLLKLERNLMKFSKKLPEVSISPCTNRKGRRLTSSSVLTHTHTHTPTTAASKMRNALPGGFSCTSRPVLWRLKHISYVPYQGSIDWPNVCYGWVSLSI